MRKGSNLNREGTYRVNLGLKSRIEGKLVFCVVDCACTATVGALLTVPMSTVEYFSYLSLDRVKLKYL